MSSQRYTPEFKNEAVRQIVERGYSVTEVSERLGVSAHSLYKKRRRGLVVSPSAASPPYGRNPNYPSPPSASD